MPVMGGRAWHGTARTRRRMGAAHGSEIERRIRPFDRPAKVPPGRTSTAACRRREQGRTHCRKATAPTQANGTVADPNAATATGRRDRSPAPGRRPDIALRQAPSRNHPAAREQRQCARPQVRPRATPGIGPARALLVDPPHRPRRPLDRTNPAGRPQAHSLAPAASTSCAPRFGHRPGLGPRASPALRRPTGASTTLRRQTGRAPAPAIAARCGQPHPCPTQGGLPPYPTARRGASSPVSPAQRRRCAASPLSPHTHAVKLPAASPALRPTDTTLTRLTAPAAAGPSGCPPGPR
jgi:hypothetical protein